MMPEAFVPQSLEAGSSSSVAAAETAMLYWPLLSPCSLTTELGSFLQHEGPLRRGHGSFARLREN